MSAWLTVEILLIVLTWVSRKNSNLGETFKGNKLRYGYYPEVVLGGQHYGAHDNRRFLKKSEVRFGGKALGRPKKQTA